MCACSVEIAKRLIVFMFGQERSEGGGKGEGWGEEGEFPLEDFCIVFLLLILIRWCVDGHIFCMSLNIPKMS